MTYQGFAALPRHILHDPAVPAHAKWVLLVLSSHVGNDNTCYPSHSSIASTCGLSVSAVQRALRWLRAEDYVSWTTVLRPDKREGNRYTLTFSTLGKPANTHPGLPDRGAGSP